MQLLITLQDAHITFGGKPLFDNLSLNIHQGDKICLIGKNGAGKTTLMNILSDQHQIDSGKFWKMQNITSGYLEQDVIFDQEQTIFQYVFSGLDSKNQIADNEYLVSQITEPLQLNMDDQMTNLSGGQLRRTALAKSLISEPDILLLDEPTNHMDFEAVIWLENYLRRCRSTVICISHDRTFLRNISNKVWWLDRGSIRVCPKGYGYFESWSQTILEQEERELMNRQRILAGEEEWASRGVQGRRKRNVKRLADFRAEREKLKIDQASFRTAVKKLELEPIGAEMSSKVVAEFIKVSKEFRDDNRCKTILKNFNLRFLRGERIGILGKNGSGKSSFLKLLIEEITPDSGKIKLANNIQISYFDQNRVNLKQNESLWKNLCPNGDYINVMGKNRHVCGYLKDFLFNPKSANDIVSTLSGGQKNRLMLAKVLANPGNCLILDEPTNDLDMDTLDMLEDILLNYNGTLFVVSHDRDFLDKTVNKIIAFEGDGKVEGYLGGYSDYLEATKSDSVSNQVVSKSAESKSVNVKKSAEKLTYKLQFELDNLPDKITNLELELKILNQKFSDPNFFEKDPKNRDKDLIRSKEIVRDLEEKERRWLELEGLKEGKK